MIDKVTRGIIPGSPLMVGYHRFSVGLAGELLHYTGADPTADTLRASVPPEGWEAYGSEYPDAQSVIEQLTLAGSPAAAAHAPPPPDMVAVAAAAIAVDNAPGQ
jgi:hypothetical protein